MRKIFIALMLIPLSITLMAGQPDITIPEVQKTSLGQENPVVLDRIHIDCIVTVGTEVFYTGAVFSFYGQLSEGGPFSGISAAIRIPEGLPVLIPGDSVSFDAAIIDVHWPHGTAPWYNVAEATLELLSSGHPIPEVMHITAEMLDSTNNADSLALQYAYCPVKIYDVTVDSVVVFSNTSTWICHDATLHQFFIREASDSISYIPTQGTEFDYVQGVLCYRQGNYYIQPAYMTDLDIVNSIYDDDNASLPKTATLFQNYPNPFNSSTAIAFSLTEPTSLKLKIYDLLGRDIRTLADSYYEPGHYTIEFDAAQLPSGMYFYSLQAGIFSDTKRLLLMK